MNTPHEPDDAPAAADPTPSRRIRAVSARAARWSTAAVGFVAALLGVVFVLFPALKPSVPVTPPDMRATVSAHPSAAILTYGQYLDRSNVPRGQLDAVALGRRGIVVQFDFTITGYQNRALPIRWELLDARQGDQLDQSADATITSSAPVSDSGVYYIWAPLPNRRADPVYVAVQLLQPKDAGVLQLAHGETPPIKLPPIGGWPPSGRVGRRVCAASFALAGRMLQGPGGGPRTTPHGQRQRTAPAVLPPARGFPRLSRVRARPVAQHAGRLPL